MTDEKLIDHLLGSVLERQSQWDRERAELSAKFDLERAGLLAKIEELRLGVDHSVDTQPPMALRVIDFRTARVEVRIWSNRPDGSLDPADEFYIRECEGLKIGDILDSQRGTANAEPTAQPNTPEVS